jgi:hypothetical protein
MLKLKQLQEKKKREAEAAKKAAEDSGANGSDPDANGNANDHADGKSDANEADAAGDAKVGNVFSIKKGGRKGKSRANAAQLRAQKDVSGMFEC